MAKVLFGLAFSDPALRFLDEMPPGKVRAQLSKRAKALIYNPHPPGYRKLKGMPEGSEPVYRIWRGDYRILYVIREIEVVILDIAKREDVDK
jgi:mRNA interferase RelE/StbE